MICELRLQGLSSYQQELKAELYDLFFHIVQWKLTVVSHEGNLFIFLSMKGSVLSCSDSPVVITVILNLIKDMLDVM